MSDVDLFCRDRINLYKHLRAEYADMLQCGSLRMSDIKVYHDVKVLGREIGDADEGIKGQDTDIEFAAVDGDSVVGDTRVRQVLPAVGQTQPCSIINTRVTQYSAAPPSLCWCLTRDVQPATAERMDPAYDATVKVGITTDFLVELRLAAQAYGLDVHSVYLGKIAYVAERRSRDGGPHTGYLPALIKDVDYEYQDECRVVIECVVGSTVPRYLDLQVPTDLVLSRVR